jgi:hypothetical protein
MDEYYEWSNKVMKGLRGVNPALEKEYDRLYKMRIKTKET